MENYMCGIAGFCSYKNNYDEKPDYWHFRLEKMLPWLLANKDALIRSLLDGSYRPNPVKRVEIPKDNGKMHLLGHHGSLFSDGSRSFLERIDAHRWELGSG